MKIYHTNDKTNNRDMYPLRAYLESTGVSGRLLNGGSRINGMAHYEVRGDWIIGNCWSDE